MLGRAKIAAVAGLMMAAGLAVAQQAPEHELKAAFIYNFVLFTDWPPEALPDSAGAIQMCTAGRGPVVTALESLDGKQVKTRRLTVRAATTAESARACHVLYVAPAGANLPALVAAVNGSPVLVVSDGEDAAAHAVIVLDVAQGKVVFDVANESAKRARLAISSRLLRLARAVR